MKENPQIKQKYPERIQFASNSKETGILKQQQNVTFHAKKGGLSPPYRVLSVNKIS